MSDEPFALSTITPAPAARGDYDAICATVMESARGRWFLQEYARRNRNADTRLVLDAIERIEGVIRGERGQQANQGFRVELLEMARTIAATRAEVAEISPDFIRHQETQAAAAPASDVLGAVERIQEVAWTMRERGLDPSTCDQIEALATSILSASALRDPNDGRARKLAEVLQQLERRINAMLDSCAESAQAASEGASAHAANTDPVAPTVAAEVAAYSESMPVASEAEGQSATRALLIQHIEAGPVGFAEQAPAPASAALDDMADAWVEAAPTPAVTAEPQAQPAQQAAAVAELRFGTAELELAPLLVVPAVPPAPDGEMPTELALEPIAIRLPAAPAIPAAAEPSEPPDQSSSDREPAIVTLALPAPAVTVAAVELTDFVLEPLPQPAAAKMATAFETGPAVPQEPTPFDVMSEIEEELFAAFPVEETVPGLAPAPTRPMPRPAPSDPLAALKAMSDEERIALFT